jgi:rsbT co-antagonist protein RsbR
VIGCQSSILPNPHTKGALVKTIRTILQNPESLLGAWILELEAAGWGSDGKFGGADWKHQAAEFLQALSVASREGMPDLKSADAREVRNFLETLSRSMAEKGASSSETATWVFSLKKPVFARLNLAITNDAAQLASETWAASELIDRLGLFTVSTFQKTREEIIRRQQEEMLELSTPVVKLWDGVLALPMIGTLDSARTQVVMESLLQRIVDTGSEIAIIDITGVPTVDTLVAQHLLKTVTAIRLMGADCIISGIRPQIAQTIVHLGIDLQGISTKATLADALTLALKRSGYTISSRAQTA